MASILPGFECDIFVSYRHNDNLDGWVTDFVFNLEKELKGTLKDSITIYFDRNPRDGLLETHNVDKSLEGKLKCLIFIPIISQTYCDPKSFAWQHEFRAFNMLAKEDQFGRDIKLSNGNVASRILPIKIHDIDTEDKTTIENEVGGELRAIEFIYKEAGVNRPIKSNDSKADNQNKTDYRNQVNKVANAIKELLAALRSDKLLGSGSKKSLLIDNADSKITGNKKLFVSIFLFVLLLATASYFFYSAKVGKESAARSITMPANEEAFKFLLRAKYFLNLSDNSSQIDSAIVYLEASIGLDPKFALAHAMLSHAYALKLFFIDPSGPWGEKAFVESEQALTLDSDLAYGHFAKGFAEWAPLHKFPHEDCIREYKKAIELDKTFDEAYNQLANVLSHVGLIDESKDLFQKCTLLNPSNEVAKSNFARAFFYNQEHKEVIRSFRKTPPSIYNISYRTTVKATSLLHEGEYQKAEMIINEVLATKPEDIPMHAVLAVLKSIHGDSIGSLQNIRMAEKGAINPKGHYHHVAYDIGAAYALLGKKEKAFYWLNWANENGFPCYASFSKDQFLNKLRGYAPFEQLLLELQSTKKELKIIYEE
jgi:tetratricopeptide (TPR) repeat protein